MDHKFITLFDFHTYSCEVIYMYPHLKKKKVGFFSDTIKQDSQTLYDYDLTCDSRFDDLNLVSRSQVCHKHQMQIVCFRFLSTVV